MGGDFYINPRFGTFKSTLPDTVKLDDSHGDPVEMLVSGKGGNVELTSGFRFGKKIQLGLRGDLSYDWGRGEFEDNIDGDYTGQLYSKPECEKYDAEGYASGNSGDADSCSATGASVDANTNIFSHVAGGAAVTLTWQWQNTKWIDKQWLPDELTFAYGGGWTRGTKKAQVMIDDKYGTADVQNGTRSYCELSATKYLFPDLGKDNNGQLGVGLAYQWGATRFDVSVPGRGDHVEPVTGAREQSLMVGLQYRGKIGDGDKDTKRSSKKKVTKKPEEKKSDKAEGKKGKKTEGKAPPASLGTVTLTLTAAQKLINEQFLETMDSISATKLSGQDGFYLKEGFVYSVRLSWLETDSPVVAQLKNNDGNLVESMGYVIYRRNIGEAPETARPMSFNGQPVTFEKLLEVLDQ